MGKPGVIAFPVLLVLGAITGYLAYDMLVIQSTPVQGIYDNSPYRKDLVGAQAQSSPSENSTEEKPSEEAQATEETPATETPSEETTGSVVTISILKGSSAQGAPDYDLDATTVSLADTIKWVNNDSLLHTATSGTGFDDENYGSAFDTGFLAPGKEKSIAASEIGVGEYSYFCQAHPFMQGTLKIE